MKLSSNTGLIRALVALFVVAALFQGAVAADDQAHLIVHKSVAETQLVIGRNMTIEIMVYNAGENIATGVEINDPGWDSSSFEMLGPSTSAKFASIAPMTKKTHRFVVVPKVTGQFSAGPSLVTYTAAAGHQASGTSNTIPEIPILTPTEAKIEVALKIGSYLTLGLCNSTEECTKAALITTVLVGLLTVNWIALKGKRAVAEAQRKQAMKSLGINPKDVAEKSVKKKKKK